MPPADECRRLRHSRRDHCRAAARSRRRGASADVERSTAPRGRPRALCAGRRSPRLEAYPGSRCPASTRTAQAISRRAPVQTSSSTTRPAPASRIRDRSSRDTLACCSRVLGWSEVAGDREQRAGDLVRRHQRDGAPGAGEPFGHADADRSADRVVNDDVAGRQRLRPAVGRHVGRPPVAPSSRVAVAVAVAKAYRGGAGGNRWQEPPTGRPPGRRRGRPGRSRRRGRSPRRAAAFGLEPVDQVDRRSRPGPTAAFRSVPPSLAPASASRTR